MDSYSNYSYPWENSLLMNRDEEYPEACLENKIFDVWLARQEFLVDTPSACRGVRSFESHAEVSVVSKKSRFEIKFNSSLV